MQRLIDGKRVPMSTEEESAILAERAATTAGPPVEKLRAAAVMERGPFCQKLWRLGLLPQAEAVQSARGEWPATFASFTAGMSIDDRADAEIEWAGAATIRYAAPSLQALALHHANGDQAEATALLDQIFGITP